MKRTALVAAIAFAASGITTTAVAHDTFKARLSGDQEAPPVGPVVTDTTGRVEVQLSKDQQSAEFTLRVDEGVRVTQAHFHCGPAGVNGPIIIFLAGFHPNGWDVDGKWVSNTTITNANIVNTACGTTLAEIFEQARAGNVYANVHSVDHPAGVARGQLEPAGK
jgi:hypothetical protein